MKITIRKEQKTSVIYSVVSLLYSFDSDYKTTIKKIAQNFQYGIISKVVLKGLFYISNLVLIILTARQRSKQNMSFITRAIHDKHDSELSSHKMVI